MFVSLWFFQTSMSVPLNHGFVLHTCSASTHLDLTPAQVNIFTASFTGSTSFCIHVFLHLLRRACSSAPLCVFHCGVSDVSSGGRSFDSAHPYRLPQVCVIRMYCNTVKLSFQTQLLHESVFLSSSWWMKILYYSVDFNISYLQVFSPEAHRERTLSGKKLKWHQAGLGNITHSFM